MIVHETEHWRVELADDDQSYLGRCVVVAKRPVGALADLTDAEWLDFAAVARRMEGAARTALRATMFNWTCLMNAAWQADPIRPQVHWHFRPRYQQPVSFAGATWTDEAFGSHYVRGTSRPVGAELAQRIVSALREGLRDVEAGRS